MSEGTMATPMTPAPGDGGPGPVPVPLAAPPARIQPRRIWYLAPLLVLAGGVALLVLGLLSLISHVDSFPRVAIPAGGEVSLSRADGYVVYYEGPGAQSGHIPAFGVRGGDEPGAVHHLGHLRLRVPSGPRRADLAGQPPRPVQGGNHGRGRSARGQRSRVRRQHRPRNHGHRRAQRAAHLRRAGRAGGDPDHPHHEDQAGPGGGVRGGGTCLVAARPTAVAPQPHRPGPRRSASRPPGPARALTPRPSLVTPRLDAPAITGHPAP